MTETGGDIRAQIERSIARGDLFDVFHADVPWHFKANSKKNWGRNAGRHYDLMTLGEIEGLPVKQIAASPAVLFFWVTGPFLAIGAHIPIMKAWGFAPTAVGFTWVKQKKTAPSLFMDKKLDLHVGLGLTTRKNAEWCIIGKRGRSMRQSNSVQEVAIEPVMEHSRKPAVFRERIEEYVGPGLRMAELFARESADGWVPFGNQTGKFNGKGK